MEVLVFKTNIRYKKEMKIINAPINQHPGIIKWNMDLKDSDKILRVVGDNVPPSSIERIVKKAGFICEELQD